MKTKFCTPTLVEIKSENTLNSDRKHLSLFDGKLYNPFKNRYYDLILISLDDNERIDVGDKYFDSEVGYVDVLRDGELPMSYDKKVIVKEKQIPLKYLNQFIEEYNKKGEVKDVEIEWQTDWNKETIMCMEGYGDNPDKFPFEPKPKLTNGFITIVYKTKEPIYYTEDEVKNLCSKSWLKQPNTTNMLVEFNTWFDKNKKK